MFNNFLFALLIFPIVFFTNRVNAFSCSLDSATIQTTRKEIKADLTNVLMYDFFTSFSLLNYQNAIENDQHNQLSFYYNGTINNTLKSKRFTYKLFLFNEYGFRYFIDSITTKNQDAYSFRNSIQFPLKHKRILLNISFDVKSQLWHGYNTREIATGVVERYLFTDYFSPGYKIFSFGLSYTIKNSVSIDLGIVGGKITKIRNDNLFESRLSKTLYGVERGENKKIDYGLNISLNAPMQSLKPNLAWECNAILFASKPDLFTLNAYTFDINNAFHFIFLKHLRLSLRSQIKYDKNIQASIFVMNTLTMGFYLNNKL